MPDWTKSMKQTFEYFVVDPGTWKDIKPLRTVTGSTISWDLDSETLGSASIDVTDNVDECYIRTYLVTIQNGVKERFPLGTVMVQTPSYKFDGRVRTNTLDAYSPLIELKETQPEYGYTIMKGTNILERAGQLTRENVRAPVVTTSVEKTLYSDFTADVNDTWLSYLGDFLSNANYQYSLDEMGRILLAPYVRVDEMQPVWTFTDDENSIFYPDMSVSRDLYGIPNVVEVVYSSDGQYYVGRAVNEESGSPISVKNRGRKIVYRETSPSFTGTPSQAQVQEYAENLLKKKSSLEYTVTYKHGYCQNRIGDCVLLNYTRAGLNNVKAKVTQQTITCEPGCPVEETAVYTRNLWR